MGLFVKKDSPIAQVTAETAYRQSWLITLAWAVLIGCTLAMKYIAHYPGWVDSLSIALAGLIIAYYARTLPTGFVERLNRKETPFHRVPTGGRHARAFFLIAGVVLLVLGLFKLGYAVVAH